MDIFISWSGERSRRVAEALRNWLPKIINALKPWLSSADIDKGARWSTDVAGKLEASKVGIICLTPSNLHADWILFEAGALSKTIQNTFVCPLLVGLEPADVRGPLAQFQATRATKDEVRKLLITVNSALSQGALTEPHLNEAFEVWWPKLEEQLQSLPPDEEAERPERPEREILEEILALVRSDARIAPRVSVPVVPRLSSFSDVVSRSVLRAGRELGVDINGFGLEFEGDEAVITISTTDGPCVVRMPNERRAGFMIMQRIRNAMRAQRLKASTVEVPAESS